VDIAAGSSPCREIASWVWDGGLLASVVFSRWLPFLVKAISSADESRLVLSNVAARIRLSQSSCRMNPRHNWIPME
jgi:hypothetical protein